jgi:hypothetical protein
MHMHTRTHTQTNTRTQGELSEDPRIASIMQKAEANAVAAGATTASLKATRAAAVGPADMQVVSVMECDGMALHFFFYFFFAYNDREPQGHAGGGSWAGRHAGGEFLGSF